MKNIDNIIKNILLETEVSRNSILNAIKNKTKVIVQKPFDYEDSISVESQNVIITDIDDDNIITGKTDNGEEITFSPSDILTSLDEGIDVTNADSNTIKKINAAGGNKGISMSANKVSQMDTSKLGDLMKKSDQAGVDINLTEQIDVHLSEGNHVILDQQISVENLIAWSTNVPGVELGSKKYKGDVVNYTMYINNAPVEVYIYPSGEIKIGGHNAKTEDIFNRIIAFYKDNQ